MNAAFPTTGQFAEATVQSKVRFSVHFTQLAKLANPLSAFQSYTGYPCLSPQIEASHWLIDQAPLGKAQNPIRYLKSKQTSILHSTGW